MENETIKINIDLDLREVREFQDIISDLTDAIRLLGSTSSDIQVAIKGLADEMSSTSFDGFDRTFNTMIATLALY